jgi:hypothetical protein
VSFDYLTRIELLKKMAGDNNGDYIPEYLLYRTYIDESDDSVLLKNSFDYFVKLWGIAIEKGSSEYNHRVESSYLDNVLTKSFHRYIRKLPLEERTSVLQETLGSNLWIRQSTSRDNFVTQLDIASDVISNKQEMMNLKEQYVKDIAETNAAHLQNIIILVTVLTGLTGLCINLSIQSNVKSIQDISRLCLILITTLSCFIAIVRKQVILALCMFFVLLCGSCWPTIVSIWQAHGFSTPWGS